MIFTIGNIITLCIVALTLILYRLADKNSRPLERVKKYAEKCKEEIAVYAEEKSMAVKNFGIDLDVEKKAALKLMENIQKLTAEELAKKSESIARIDEHINAFESSLEELFGMTDRVQENLNRIRDESAFVENTGKRVNEAKEKFEQVEKALNAAQKNLQEIETRMERKNAENLEQTALEVVSSAKSIVSDFEATAQVIERKIGEHRDAVIKTEREREALLARDLELVKKTLKETVENAGKRADKMEDAALVKLREQALERVNQIKTFFEEKIKSVQETLKTEQGTVNEKIKAMHDKWSTEFHDIGSKQKTFHQEWVKGSAELDSMAKKQKEEIITSLSRQQEEINTALFKERDTINSALVQQQNEWKQNFIEFKKQTEKQRKELDTSIITTKNELNQSLQELRVKSITAIKQQHDDLETVVKSHQKEISLTISELKEKSGAAIKSQQQETETLLSKLNTSHSELQAQSKSMIKQQQEEFGTVLGELKGKANSMIVSQQNEINTALEKQMESWKTLCRDTEQNIITANEKRLDDYSKIQIEAVKQLNSLADDAGRLEKELRVSMQEAVSRVKSDFSGFEKEAGASMETASAAFNAQAQVFKKELEEINKELNVIKQQAINNVSENLANFEKDFTAELGKRASEAGRQIADWQAGLQERLENSTGKINHDWQQAEERLTADQRKNIAVLGERLTLDLERLKQEASAFEKGIREEMNNFDETRLSFAEQIKQDLTEIRVTAHNEVKTQVGQHHLSMQETLRLKQRELEKEIEEISASSQNAYASLDEKAVNTRQTYDEWQSSYNARMREMDNSLEELRRHSRETAAENDERVSSFRKNLEDIRKELGVQKKIFEQTGELKQDLESRIEEINADLDRLDQRKNEITQLENQFTHIKRLEDEVNRKMTSFLSERHRIEVMEKDFERFIKTSQSVEAKLNQVSTSDDILQSVQVQIRKLEDSLKETEEKYQRIERKNEVLEETNESIDRNFKMLQKTETAIKNAENIINVLSDQFDNMRSSIEALAVENVKATDAVEKITVLDESLVQLEKRIADMNVAREWLARTETELKALDKDARTHLKLAKGLFERESGKAAVTSKGAPPPQDRDNVLRLKDQGWTIEEIANAMNMGRGEVELILEIGSRG